MASLSALHALPWQQPDWDALTALQTRNLHAVLLHGAAGIGKKVLAFDLARARLCEARRPDGYACGSCAACVWLHGGHHPDLRIVVPEAIAWLRQGASDEVEEGDARAEAPSEAETDTGKSPKASREILIDQVRRLADFLNVSTHRGGQRVVVLTPAERLNTAAANALLKMLEEPPPGTLFILTADAIDDVLPTIRSRCLLHRCHAPDRASALAWLRAQVVPDAETALTEAGGAPLAAWLAQDGRLDTGARLDQETRAALIAMLGQGPRLGAAEIATRIPKTIAVEPAITMLQRWAWDLLALSTGGTVRYHPREMAPLGLLVRAESAPAILAWIDQLTRLRATRDHPLNARMVVESALLSYVDCLGGAAAGAPVR
ncbi:MAG: DNA polymerase III subunit delta' [Betaproteobacteria bacterium]